MQSIDHSLDVISAHLKLPNLRLDENGQLGLDLPGKVTVHLTQVADGVLEISTPLSMLDYPDKPLMEAMLQSNFLGAAVDSARLAIDADKGEVVICERWYVADMDAGVLERRLDAFMAAATFWHNEGVDSLLDLADAIRAESATSSFAPQSHEDEAEDPDAPFTPPFMVRL